MVGTARLPRTTTASELPTIVAAAHAGAGRLDVGLANRSGVPQYDLQVYAVATRGGRDVGAARTTVADLEGGARTTVSLPVTGHTTGAAIQVYALPTIFS